MPAYIQDLLGGDLSVPVAVNQFRDVSIFPFFSELKRNILWVKRPPKRFSP